MLAPGYGLLFPSRVMNPDSGIREIFACGIRNTAQGIRNPTKTKTGPGLEIRNPKMPWFSLHGTKLRNTCEIVLLFLHSYKYLFQGFFVAVLFPTDGLYC